MAQLTKDELQVLLDNAPSDIPKVEILNSLVRRGYTLEGVDMDAAREFASRSVVEEPKGIIGETVEDVRQIGTGLKEDIERRAEKVGEIKRADVSEPSRIFQVIGQGAGFAGDVIGRTVTGVGKALLPERAERAVAEAFTGAVTRVVDEPSVKELQTKYQELKRERPELAANVEAGANLLLLLGDVAGVGVGSRAVQPVGRAVGRGVAATGKGVQKTGQLGTKVATEIEGALTGTSGETIEQAFQAARRGGPELEAYTNALRKQTTPEQLVESARTSIDVISSRKTTQFSEAIERLGKEKVDTRGVLPQVEATLNKLKIVPNDNGVLQFNASRFRTVPEAQKKLQSMYDEVRKLGSSQTLDEVDTSRQALGNLLLAGDDASARTANLAITDAKNSVRKAGSSVDGYEQALKNFADDAEFLNELNRSLATGDAKTIDTAYRRLATTLKTNNEQRMKLLKELDAETDGLLLSTIAGQQLSEEFPRGIFRQIAAGIVAGGVFFGGTASSILPALVFASPRVVGEFVRALGLSAAKTRQIIDTVKSARKLFGGDNLP